MYSYHKVAGSDYADVLKRIGYRKRSFAIREMTPTEMRLRSYWDGGSRNEYAAFRGNVRLDIPVSGAPFYTPDPQAWTPQAGDIVVVHGTFCGKPATAFITKFV